MLFNILLIIGSISILGYFTYVGVRIIKYEYIQFVRRQNSIERLKVRVRERVNVSNVSPFITGSNAQYGITGSISPTEYSALQNQRKPARRHYK